MRRDVVARTTTLNSKLDGIQTQSKYVQIYTLAMAKKYESVYVRARDSHRPSSMFLLPYANWSVSATYGISMPVFGSRWFVGFMMISITFGPYDAGRLQMFMYEFRRNGFFEKKNYCEIVKVAFIQKLTETMGHQYLLRQRNTGHGTRSRMAIAIVLHILYTIHTAVACAHL